MSWEYATCNTNIWTDLLCVAQFHEMKISHIVFFGPEHRPLTCLPHYLCSPRSLQAVVRPSRSLSSAHLVPSCNSIQAFIISNIVLMKGHGKVTKHKSQATNNTMHWILTSRGIPGPGIQYSRRQRQHVWPNGDLREDHLPWRCSGRWWKTTGRWTH